MVSASTIPLAGLALLYAALATPAAALPASRSCHNPDALGIARTITIGGAPEIGLKTYPQTLALGDHEVVLTFDDGPSPATTPAVLQALADQCVTATFFLIGRNAQAHPDLVRREIAEGHSVGHHSWDHPAVTLRGLEPQAALAEIIDGMKADDKAAGYGAWTGRPRVPFFRFPGFGDTAETRAFLKIHDIADFGADLWASDWVPMTPDAELDRLMGRLRAAGRGIILLHDIKKQTADMLPRFLAALKAEGFRVVNLAPGGDATPLRAAPAGWTSETEQILAHMWPKGRSGAMKDQAPSAAAATEASAQSEAPPQNNDDLPLRPSEE